MQESTHTKRFFKTRMCRFYSASKCFKGDECSHAHSREELLQRPNLRKTSLCRHWARRGSCGKDTQCPYAHGIQELRSQNVTSIPVNHVPGMSDDTQKHQIAKKPEDSVRSVELRPHIVAHDKSLFNVKEPVDLIKPNPGVFQTSKTGKNFVQYHPSHWIYYHHQPFAAMGVPAYQVQPILSTESTLEWSPRSWITDQD